MVEKERDGWILISARWPDRVREWVPEKLAQLEDPRIVRLYQVLSQLLELEGGGQPLVEEAADIMAEMLDQAYAAGENLGDIEQDDLPFDLLDALALEAHPQAQRMFDLMRERGWVSWTRQKRVDQPSERR
jgi:hypothetical protein